MTFLIKQNDTSPTLKAPLKDVDNAAVSLAGATERFHMRRVGTGAVGFDSAASIIGDGSRGRFDITGQHLTRPLWERTSASLKLPLLIILLKYSQTLVSSPSRLLTIWHDFV